MASRSFSWRLAALFGAVFLGAVAIGWLAAKRSTEHAVSDLVETSAPVEAPTKVAAHLYFGDFRGDYLMAEQQVIDKPVDEAAFGRYLVQALIQGPQKRGSRTLPEGAMLRAVYCLANVDGEGETAVVDFDARAFDEHPRGVHAELLSIYSIVNTLVFNMNNIRQVKILIGGREAETLAGHVNLSLPFAADMLWVR